MSQGRVMKLPSPFNAPCITAVPNQLTCNYFLILKNTSPTL